MGLKLMAIKIVLVDDHALMRDGLRSLLQARPDYAVIGEANDGHQAIELVRDLAPDIVLMDIYMPRTGGIEATGRIRTLGYTAKIIAVSACTDRKAIVQILAAGAWAYVAKAWPAGELFRAIDSVYAGLPYEHRPTVDIPDVAGEPWVKCGKLSARELQTLQLIAVGKSSRDIAAALSVGLKTVEADRSRLRKKLGRPSVADLVRYAIEEGIVGNRLTNESSTR
jgi:DNA-binding NarL/FixJ family response regulator